MFFKDKSQVSMSEEEFLKLYLDNNTNDTVTITAERFFELLMVEKSKNLKPTVVAELSNRGNGSGYGKYLTPSEFISHTPNVKEVLVETSELKELLVDYHKTSERLAVLHEKTKVAEKELALLKKLVEQPVKNTVIRNSPNNDYIHVKLGDALNVTA